MVQELAARDSPMDSNGADLMPEQLKILVYADNQLVLSELCAGPIEFGRQRGGSEQPYSVTVSESVTRVVIARHDESAISRNALRVERAGPGRVLIKNCSTNVDLRLDAVDLLRPNDSRERDLPQLLTLGPRTVRIDEPDIDSQDPALQSLPQATAPPGSAEESLSALTLLRTLTSDDLKFIRWLRSVMNTIHSAATRDELFRAAEQAMIRAIGLETATVQLFADGEWRSHSQNRFATAPSATVLDQVKRERKAVWAIPQAPATRSLQNVRAVLAAPILDRGGALVGALYGDRRVRGRRITEGDAALVELLASAVATALARMAQERAALTAEVRFKQFFTPELAQSLGADPSMLEGRDTQITVMFADVRDYSRVSEKLDSAETSRWMRDVLGELSACVRAHGGVLIDYIGDELMALWGAPESQPDHAARATRAAVDMLRVLPKVSERWQERLGEPTRIGIGIHSGPAWVGEIGTEHKFKYGPLGNTVNVASRVQGATKHVRTPALLTGAVRAGFGDEFPVRRLTSVRVVNISTPVDLYELVGDPSDGWPRLQAGYESALHLFETGDASATARQLSNLLAEFRGDPPSLLLLQRAVEILAKNIAEYDPVLNLLDK